MANLAGFIMIFSVTGFIISTVSGFFAGNRIGHILLVSSLGTLSFSGLGAGVYKVIESRVPEFLELLQDMRFSGSAGGDGGEDDVAILDTPAFEQEMGESSFAGESAPKAPRRKDGNFGDHLVVDNIEIKNEPKLMAEAIRTMLARDEDA